MVALPPSIASTPPAPGSRQSLEVVQASITCCIFRFKYINPHHVPPPTPHTQLSNSSAWTDQVQPSYTYLIDGEQNQNLLTYLRLMISCRDRQSHLRHAALRLGKGQLSRTSPLLFILFTPRRRSIKDEESELKKTRVIFKAGLLPNSVWWTEQDEH